MATSLSLFITYTAGLALYVAWAALHLHADPSAAWWPYVIGVPLLYAAVILAITLADFALAWCWRTPRRPDERIGPWRTLGMIAREFGVLLRSGPSMMLYPLTMRRPAAGRDVLPVVLVHGVLCNGGAWNDVAAACEAHGLPTPYRLSYGPPLAAIERFADELHALIDQACQDTGARRVVIVGHSMGGLVARGYLERHGGARVAAVITLGTPYRGSRFACLMVGQSLSQMRPGSAWLTAHPPVVTGHPPFTALWSRHDSMVAPQASCELTGARNIALLGYGHNTLLHDRKVIACVVDELLRLRAQEAAAGDDAQSRTKA
jgi:triacylglycerol esterase/lipase EstA (alpha/beta hydrolase family)